MAASKTSRTAKTSKNKTTYSRPKGRELLLSIMIDELNEVGEADIRLEVILERAQISPSSLYHHFGNLRGLIEEAHVERFVREIYGRLDELKVQLEDMETRDDFIKIVDGTLDIFFTDQRKLARFRRLNALGSSYGRPEFAKRLAGAERDANKRTAEVLKVAQYRGFIAKSVDLEVFAAWLNASLVGGTAIDLMDDDDFRKKWTEMVRATTKYLLGLDTK